MTVTDKSLKSINRRQFIRLGATTTAGLFLAACGANPPTAEPTPTEVVQRPTDTPIPPTATTAPTDTPIPLPAGTNAPTAEPTATATNTAVIDPDQLLIADMTLAATAYLEALDDGQRSISAYDFASDERFRWHWTTPGNFPRNGLPLREMTETQRSRAFDLLAASLSGMGFQKSLDIISLQNDLGNDSELYYVTVFGMPGGDTPWGWRWEGHHLSRQFTVVGDRLAMLPFFLGSWPTTTQAGLRAMAQEEDAALELINSFSGDMQAQAIFQDRTLTQHVTQNAAKVDPLEPIGVAYADMSGSQQQLVTEIMQAYLNTLPDHVAAASFERIDAAGLEPIRFGWAGSLDRQRPQYFRVQGPTFLLEYDNSRNGGTHIHSVWRDFEHDFGYHLL